jgi:putative membrane-bound dehydrogenase-like protein
MNRRAFASLFALALASVSVSAADDFPKPIDTEPDKSPVMPAEQAASSFKVADGFKISVFAAEPEVRNPIAMAWDAKGRLWVAENYTYAERSARFDLRHRDRVVIFEDSDGDGKHDKRTVFTDDVQMLTSVEVGLGGAYLFCPPQLLFVPDRNGDDKPDAAPEVVLDGFTVPPENYHNFANGLRWGPDGWLYGRCGASSPGKIGVPGTPDAERTPMTGGIWRFDPKSKRFEVLCHGTTNPWGHDWDALGEAFFINTVNGHLWHMIPGAHFVRPHTIDLNPKAYAAIDQHADHFHWDTAKDWSDSRNVSGEHDRRGGGHAHSGLMIYQGAQWPVEDAGKLFTLNFHGRRMNEERLERVGSGFLGRHEPDRFFASDPKFRGIDLGYGPDGGVFVLDWNDAGECHESNGVLRSTGRVFKITKGEPKRPEVGDLATLDLSALVALHRHSNEWYARMARRQLLDRASRGESVEGALPGLNAILANETAPNLKLRALWTLFALGSVDETTLRSLLSHDHEALRVWAIRLLTDKHVLDTVTSGRPTSEAPLPADLLDTFARMARDDRSGLVRLTLASTLQRLPHSQRAALAAPLLARKEDANDPNLPLLVWYGLIPLADSDASALAKLGADCVWPTTLRLITRRLTEEIEARPGPLNELLTGVSRLAWSRQVVEGHEKPSRELQGGALRSGSNSSLTDVINGMTEGLQGWRKAPKPAAWDDFANLAGSVKDNSIDSKIRELEVVFGDGRALDALRKLALDDKAALETRRAALRGLIENRPPDLRAICEKLLRVRFLNTTAVKGLALFDDPAIGKSLAANYRSFHPTERPAMIETLVARPSFARALLDQMAAGSIPRTDLSSFQARQIRSMGDPSLTRKLSETWGELRETSADKQAAIARLKSRLTPETLAKADKGLGRVQFNKLCAACHTLYGHGGAIGPDLTGSGRDNIDYLLENMVDPSATVNADFRMSVVAMNDGRVLNGLVRSPTDRTITLQSQNETVVLARKEIEQIAASPLSLMPEGQLDPLTPDEVRDLFAYLMHRTQVALPEGAKPK